MEKSTLSKKELKATPTIFEKPNIFLENKKMECKSYSYEQFKKLKKDNHDKNLSLLELHISLILYHIDNLTNQLYDLDFKFKVTAITEIRFATKKTHKTLLKFQITV